MKSPGVYRIFNKINKRSYIGSSSVDWRGRRNNHVCLLRKGVHSSSKLQEDWIKHGPEAFEFFNICECPPDKVLDLEEAACKTYNAFDDNLGYNTAKISGPRFRGGRPAGERKIRFSRLISLKNAKKISELFKIPEGELIQIEHGYSSGWRVGWKEEHKDKNPIIGMRDICPNEANFYNDIELFNITMSEPREMSKVTELDKLRRENYKIVSDAEALKIKNETEIQELRMEIDRMEIMDLNEDASYSTPRRMMV